MGKVKNKDEHFCAVQIHTGILFNFLPRVSGQRIEQLGWRSQDICYIKEKTHLKRVGLEKQALGKASYLTALAAKQVMGGDKRKTLPECRSLKKKNCEVPFLGDPCLQLFQSRNKEDRRDISGAVV